MTVFGEGVLDDYEDCKKCGERFHGDDANLWICNDVCLGCHIGGLRCPHCEVKRGHIHKATCPTVKERECLTEVFVTDCELPSLDYKTKMRLMNTKFVDPDASEKKKRIAALERIEKELS